MKKNFVQLLAAIFKMSLIMKKIFTAFFLRPLHLMGRFLFLLLLPVYKIYVSQKRLFIKFYSPLQNKHRLIHPFARRYVVHVFIIFLCVLVAGSNLNAYEIKSVDEGYSNILTSIAGAEELGAISEEGPIKRYDSILRHLNKTGVRSEGVDFDAQSQQVEGEIITSSGALLRPILSPSEVKIRTRDTIESYTIQPGDTVSSIAYQFGVSVNTILWENDLTNYSIIRPGQKLVILPVSGLRHTVSSGETLSEIAKKYSVGIDEIIEFNMLASANDINIGEKLIIPGGQKTPVVRTYSLRKWTEPSTPSVVIPPKSASGKMAWPSSCSRISQYFSWRHYGVDIACGYGKTISAAQGGEVVKAAGGWNGGYGIMIIIDHGNGTQTLYGHLSKLYVNEGDTVAEGQAIGAEGSTGRSTGPHVHFEVRVNGLRSNPLSYL